MGSMPIELKKAISIKRHADNIGELISVLDQECDKKQKGIILAKNIII